MSTALLRLALAWALLATAPPPSAWAGPSRFKPGQIRVMPAADLVGVTHAQIAVGQPLYLQLRNTNAAVSFVDKGMRIRLFRLTDAGQLTEWTEFAPCQVFLTTIWGPIARSGRAVYLGRLDLSWLVPDGRGKLTDGRWLLVFEDLSDASDVLRINQASVDRYRAMGLELVVDSGGGTYAEGQQPPLSPQQAASRRDQIAGADRNLPDLVCVELAETAGETKTRQATLDRCPIEPPGAANAVSTPPAGSGA